MTRKHWWMSVFAVLALAAGAPAQQYQYPGCGMPQTRPACVNNLNQLCPMTTTEAKELVVAAAEACVEKVQDETWFYDVCGMGCLGGRCYESGSCCCVKPSAVGCICGGSVATVIIQTGCCPDCCKVRKDAVRCEEPVPETPYEPSGECPLLRLLDFLEDLIDAVWPVQTWVEGQTLPSGYYLQHEPQYVPPAVMPPPPGMQAQPWGPPSMPVQSWGVPPGTMYPYPANPYSGPPPMMGGTPYPIPSPYPPMQPGTQVVPVYPPMLPGTQVVPTYPPPHINLPIPVPPMPPAPTAAEPAVAVPVKTTTCRFAAQDGKGWVEIDGANSKGLCHHLEWKLAGKSVQLAAGKTHLLIHVEGLKGHADKVISDHSGKLVLEGHVQVRHDRDGQSHLLKADRITVDLATGHLRCEVKGL
jgi:hypothetical protein